MRTRLLLARHGRAEGTFPEAALLPGGEADVRALAEALAVAGVCPVRALTSPYARARATLALLLERLAPALEPGVLTELEPEHAPESALAALRACGVGDDPGPNLVVAHMPLVSRMVWHVTGTDVPFTPATLVELDFDPEGREARIARVRDPARRGHS